MAVVGKTLFIAYWQILNRLRLILRGFFKSVKP